MEKTKDSNNKKLIFSRKETCIVEKDAKLQFYAEMFNLEHALST
jgi:hypothetical protein